MMHFYSMLFPEYPLQPPIIECIQLGRAVLYNTVLNICPKNTRDLNVPGTVNPVCAILIGSVFSATKQQYQSELW